MSTLFGYNVEELPKFAIKILNEKKIPEKNKIKFLRKFLEKYMEDVELRNELNQWYLLFRNNKYIGCFKNTEEIDETISPGENAIWYQIGVSDLFMCNEHSLRPMHVDSTKHKYGPFIVECSLKTKNKEVGDSFGMIDTGVTITSLFPDKIWDYENSAFFDSIPGELYGSSLKEELKYLKSITKPIKDVELITGNGQCEKILLEFKDPIYVSIENLNPVPIYFFVVARKKPDYLLPILIGLDIICQYELKIEQLNGIPIMTIKDKLPSDSRTISQKITDLFKLN